jgi:G3E family GTPase
MRITLLTSDPSSDPYEVVAQVLGEDPCTTVVVPGFASPQLGSAACSVIEADPEVAELEAGCSCCAVRWDLITTLGRLVDRREPPRRVVVVLDPDADVATAVQTLLGDSELRRTCVLDAVVHLMDASDLATDLAGPLPFADATDRSLAVADHVILRGLGQLGRDRAASLRRSLRLRARGASLAVTPAAAAAVLDGQQAHWTLEGTQRRRGQHLGSLLSEGGGTVRWMEATLSGVLDGDRLHDWLHELGDRPGASLLRLEGVFAVVGEDRPWIALGVRTTIELGETTLPHPPHPAASIRLVAHDLDPVQLRDGLADCCV